MLETASIAGGAVVALFLLLVVALCFYVRRHQKKKQELVDKNDTLQHPQNGQSNGHHNAAVDVVDGNVENGASQFCCQQSKIHFSSQLSSNSTNTTITDNNVSQHPQQVHSMAQVLHYNFPTPKRPFGPHHYQPVSMSDVLLKM